MYMSILVVSIVSGDGAPYMTVLILGLHTANERRRYKVTPSLISWAKT